ncbi:cellulase family glycosylhydrolase [uncultured Draconibacterium sp.]|uniref:cellulase family glycosylhydrolase n=1 Tax=uncultured Draconibacterium sp. TaxID=1573823 RepID=UPI0025EF9B92|nr:cellulase family glycosylhydrolase [uncultured Draconibacterium sp.]
MKLKLLSLLFLFHFSIYAQNREHAFELNKQLGRGINFGGMFEGFSNSVSSGKWKPEYAQMVANLGFNHVRIPIRWEPEGRSNPEAPYNINPQFLDQIKEVVDSCLNNGMFAIINMHHHEALFDDPNGQRERFLSQWKQISEYFKDYSYKLIFEILNEPHGHLTPDKWNIFLSDALAAIRIDSPDRIVSIGSADWGGLGSISELELPDDENIILTIHYYNPFSFTGQGASWIEGSDAWLGTKWNNTEPERQRVQNDFAPLKTLEEKQNIPIHIGEFGSYSTADDASREKWTTYIARYVESQGWSWAYWEFRDGYGIYNPITNRYYNFLVDALLHNPMPEAAYYAATPVYTSDFSRGNSEWDLRNNSGAVSTQQDKNDQMVISISTASSSEWHIQLVKYNVKLEAGKKYRVRFKARADNERSITAYVGEGAAPWGAYSNYNTITLNDILEEYSYTFNMTKDDNNARIKFDLGASDSDIYFESIILEAIELETPTTVSLHAEVKTKVFPNPATNQLCVSNSDDFEQLIISNANGTIVLSKQLSEHLNQIGISQMPPGIYFVTLLNQHNRFTTKMIKN